MYVEFYYLLRRISRGGALVSGIVVLKSYDYCRTCIHNLVLRLPPFTAASKTAQIKCIISEFKIRE
jgi:hypothetical protein